MHRISPIALRFAAGLARICDARSAIDNATDLAAPRFARGLPARTGGGSGR